MMSKKMVMRGGKMPYRFIHKPIHFFYSNMLLRTRPTELQPGYHVKDNKKGSEKKSS